jgi:hypothetical protein
MHGTLPDTLSALREAAPSPPSPFPIALEQASVSTGRIILLALLFPALAGLLAPFWLIVAQFASDPSARAVVADRPLVAIQLAAGLLVLLAIFGFPMAALARTTFTRRRILIDGAFVHATDSGISGTQSWVEPLGAYKGLARRVRSSLSGVRHELVLVHARPSRSVVLTSSAQISKDTVDFAARVFNLAEIPSREAASFRPLHGFPHLAEPRRQLDAAPL